MSNFWPNIFVEIREAQYQTALRSVQPLLDYKPSTVDSTPIANLPANAVSNPDFETAPEHAQVVQSLKAAVGNVNDIIGLLNQPITRTSDVIDMDYAAETVKAFKARSDDCEHNVEAASATASTWFTSVGNRLAQTTNDLGQVQGQLNDTMQQMASNTKLIEANIGTIKEQVQHMEQEHGALAKAQSEYDSAKDRLASAQAEKNRVETARNALCWMPIAYVALSVVDITKEQNDVNSAQTSVNAEAGQLTNDQKAMSAAGDKLRELQQEGLALHDKTVQLQLKEMQLKDQKAKLQADATYLGPLKVKIDQCIHTVSSALGSAENLDNMMSMKNVGDGIKGLLDALKSGDGFAGALAQMDEKGYAELDKRIRAMQTSYKRLGKLAV